MMDIKRTNSNVVQENPHPNILNQSSDNLYASNLSHKRVPQLKMSRQDVYKDQFPQQQMQMGSLRNTRPKQQLNDSKIMTSMKRSKLPPALRQSLKKRAMQSGHYKPKKSIQKISNLTKSIFAKIRKQQITCGICIGVIKDEDIVKLCNCPHVYCKGCIRDYVVYKIKTFEEVFCPQEDCNTVMSQGNEFYQNLPEDIKRQYVKVHNFYMTSNDPSLKLCPKQDCQGIIKITQNQQRICNQCKRQFCPECNFQKHKGNCQQREIEFFQNNLHYRQCSNCKTIVQRTQGCNHMTCRCKYEFCYLCGKKWKGYDHVCNQTIAEIRARNGGLFGNGGACDCCACEDTCGEVCGCLLTIPLRLFIGLLIGIFLTLLLVGMLFLITFYFIGAILAGIFGFTVDYFCQIYEQNKFIFVLFVFFPVIPLCIGIIRALREMFCHLAEQIIEEYCDYVQRTCINVWA